MDPNFVDGISTEPPMRRLAWPEVLIGRDWEIFWADDDNEEHEQTLREVSSVSPTKLDDRGSDSDGPRETTESQLEASTAGAATTLIESQLGVPPNSNPNASQSSLREKDSSGEDESDIEHEPDWYEGRVESFDPASGKFQVRFVGDEAIYNMKLDCKTIRPSVSAWVQRTVAILEVKDSMFDEWENSLPVATGCFPTEGEGFLPLELPKPLGYDDLPGIDDLEGMVLYRIRYLLSQVKAQLYLRKQLAPVDNAKDYEGGTSYTDEYIDYLSVLLKEQETGCRWFERSWDLMRRIPQQEPGDEMDVDFFWETFMWGSRNALLSHITTDTSLLGSKRKKSGKPSPDLTRGKKKRRKTRFDSDLASSGQEANCVQLLSDLELEELKSPDTVKCIAEALSTCHLSWVVSVYAKLLSSLSLRFAAPLQEWIVKSYAILGEESESDESMEILICFEDIETHLSHAAEGLLKRFNLSKLVDQLRRKLQGILQFEAKVWGELAKVFNPVDVLKEPNSDEVMCSYRTLASDSRTKTSPVGNIEIFGRKSSPLDRQTLYNAMIYRTWFIELNQAEALRERLYFVQGVISGLSKLPSLPSSSAPGLEFDAPGLISEVAPRAKKLSEKYIDHASVFSRYSSLLQEKHEVVAGARTGLFCLTGIQAALNELQAIQVISPAEEFLLVRKDLLEWESAALSVVAKVKPSFECVENLNTEMQILLSGKSKSRMETVEKLTKNPVVDDQVQRFIRNDVETHSQAVANSISTAFMAASAWRERCKSVLSNIATHNDGAAQEILSPKNTVLIPLKRLEELLTSYSTLEVDLSTLHQEVQKVYDTAVNWARILEAELAKSGLSLAQRHSALQRFGNPVRPRGVFLTPTVEELALAEQTLVWYTSTQASFAKSASRTIELNRLLLEGVDLILSQVQPSSQNSSAILDQRSIVALLSRRMPPNNIPKIISVDKLKQSVVGESCMQAILASEGATIFVRAFYLVWEDMAGAFLSEHDPSSKTLQRASALLEVMPQDAPTGFASPEIPAALQASVQQGQAAAEAARNAVTQAQELLPRCFNLAPTMQTQLATLQVLQVDMRNRASNPSGYLLVLDRSLLDHVEIMIQKLNWVAVAVQFPILVKAESAGSGTRIPYSTLLTLVSNKPALVGSEGDFYKLLVRVNQISESTSAWISDLKKITAGLTTNETKSALSMEIASLEKLLRADVLKEVIMPDEQVTKVTLESSVQFASKLSEFLGSDHSLADRAPLPEPTSLVGEDGEFVLYRLSKSEPFVSLRPAISHLVEAAQQSFTNLPGKSLFNWIFSIYQWIQELEAAVRRYASPFVLTSTKLGLQVADAQRLQLLGKSLMFQLPPEIHILGEFNIWISQNTSNGGLKVSLGTGGSLYSSGATIMKWFPLLYESLAADLRVLESWGGRLTDLSNRFLSTQDRERRGTLNSDDAHLKYLEYRFSLEDMRDEANLFVVVPPTDLSEGCSSLLHGLVTMTSKTNPRVAKKFADTKYQTGHTVVSSRHDLLSSLYGRVNVDQDTDSQPAPDNSASFRQAGRKHFSMALQKGLKGIGLDPTSAQATNLCSRTALAVEAALYEKFQLVDSEYTISKEYRTQARLIKGSLSDKRNHRLLVKVLSGEVSARQLASMNDNELAAPEIRRSRFAAEEKEKVGKLLTKGPGIQVQPPSKAPQSLPMPASHSSEDIKASNKTSQEGKLYSSVLKVAPKDSSSSKRPSQGSLPPPPPPSLAIRESSVDNAVQDRARISNTEGGDSFTFSFKGGSLSVSVELYLEEEKIAAHDKVSRYMPGDLNEKGRSSVQEFRNFLSMKLHSTSWDVYKLRVVTVGENGSRQFKNLCREYERRDKILMIRVNERDSSKLFLVTPKFLSAAKPLSFGHKRSTYAILFMRRR